MAPIGDLTILCFDWMEVCRQIQKRGPRSGFRFGPSQAEGRGFESHRPLQIHEKHLAEKASATALERSSSSPQSGALLCRLLLQEAGAPLAAALVTLAADGWGGRRRWGGKTCRVVPHSGRVHTASKMQTVATQPVTGLPCPRIERRVLRGSNDESSRGS
jgi:hypothetical protein